MTEQKVASLYAELRLDDTMTPSLGKAKSEIKNMGSEAVKWGTLSADIYKNVAGEIKSFAGSTLEASLQYDRNFANIRSITGATKGEIKGLKVEVANLSNEFLATPMDASRAFYDIAGGVADATQHMPMLRQAMLLSDATTASLDTTTQGMIATMNAYELSADDAASVTDIYAQAVGKGVGTGQEFVSALGPLGSIAAGAGVDFRDLATAIAFMTTKGTSAAVSGTNLKQALSKLQAPSAELAKVYRELGISSGEAAIKQFGLVGTLQQIDGAIGGSQARWIELLGSQEAVAAAVTLTADSYDAFSESFNTDLDGTALRQQSAQLDNAAAQWDLLQGKVQGYKLRLGEIAMPVMNEGLSTLNFIADIVFDTGSIKENAPDIGAYLPADKKTVSYTIQQGDTAQDVADRLGITLAEAQKLMQAQGAYVSYSVNPTLADFAATLGKSQEEARAIAEKAGWTVGVPTTVTAQMAVDEATKRGLDPSQPGVVEQMKLELEASAAGGVRVGVPANVELDQVIWDFAKANNVSYAEAQTFLQTHFGDREYTTKLKTGATVSVDKFEAEPPRSGTFLDHAREVINSRTDVQEVTSGQKKIALGVSAAVSIKDWVTGGKTSDADAMKLYNKVEGMVGDAGKYLEDHPIILDSATWFDPRSFDGIRDTIDDIGDAVFHPDGAEWGSSLSTSLDLLPDIVDALEIKLRIAFLDLKITAADGVNGLIDQFNNLANIGGLADTLGIDIPVAPRLDTSGMEQEQATWQQWLDQGMEFKIPASFSLSSLQDSNLQTMNEGNAPQSFIGPQTDPEVVVTPVLAADLPKELAWLGGSTEGAVGDYLVNLAINGLGLPDDLSFLGDFKDGSEIQRTLALALTANTGEMDEQAYALLEASTGEEDMHTILMAVDEGVFTQMADLSLSATDYQTLAEDPMKLSVSNPDLFKTLGAEANAAFADQNMIITVDVVVNAPGGFGENGLAAGTAAAGQAGANFGNVPQYAEGGYTGSGGLSMLHPNEAVVPAGGITLMPSASSPTGLIFEGSMGGGGGGATYIFQGDFRFEGVQDVRGFYNQLEEESKRRGK